MDFNFFFFRYCNVSLTRDFLYLKGEISSGGPEVWTQWNSNTRVQPSRLTTGLVGASWRNRHGEDREPRGSDGSTTGSGGPGSPHPSDPCTKERTRATDGGGVLDPSRTARRLVWGPTGSTLLEISDTHRRRRRGRQERLPSSSETESEGGEKDPEKDRPQTTLVSRVTGLHNPSRWFDHWQNDVHFFPVSSLRDRPPCYGSLSTRPVST